jgi:hypothetical protein
MLFAPATMLFAPMCGLGIDGTSMTRFRAEVGEKEHAQMRVTAQRASRDIGGLQVIIVCSDFRLSLVLARISPSIGKKLARHWLHRGKADAMGRRLDGENAR